MKLDCLLEVEMAVKDFVEVWHFVWSVEFWRMGVCWTLSLLLAYARLLGQRFLTRGNKSYGRCWKHSGARKPVCVITGVNEHVTLASVIAVMTVVLVDVGS